MQLYYSKPTQTTTIYVCVHRKYLGYVHPNINIYKIETSSPYCVPEQSHKKFVCYYIQLLDAEEGQDSRETRWSSLCDITFGE